MADLSGRTAIISGGLGDIGRAIAIALARCGANIALGDILPPNQAQPLLQAIRELGRRCRYDNVDVSSAEAVRGWVREVELDMGAPDLVIVNAAIVILGDFQATRAEDWSRVMRVNLDGAFHQSQACALRLLELKKTGRIVFVGSWAASVPHPHIPSYCAAKAGMRMLCECVALSLAPHGILANEVAPGYVDAGLSGKFFREQPGSREISIKQVPIHKLISPDDVALQVEHLCDPRNQHMTGSVVLMDGGLSLCSKYKGDNA
jgi:NAD(P)-dependent dehydrogenase (short-subunit alcohol dehydrogenase family)